MFTSVVKKSDALYAFESRGFCEEIGVDISMVYRDKSSDLNYNKTNRLENRREPMSVFEKWLKGIEARDADALIELLHEDFEFVRHQSGTSLNKAQMSDLFRQMISSESVVPQAHRCLYENEEVLVDHSVIDFPDGTTEAILRCSLLKDGKMIKSETGATPISK